MRMHLLTLNARLYRSFFQNDTRIKDGSNLNTIVYGDILIDKSCSLYSARKHTQENAIYSLWIASKRVITIRMFIVRKGVRFTGIG